MVWVRTWWRHQMETFSAKLAICARNSPVPGEFPAQRPVTRSFDVFFDLRLNKRLNKQSWGWWFETLSGPLWRHCIELFMHRKEHVIIVDGRVASIGQGSVQYPDMRHASIGQGSVQYPNMRHFAYFAEYPLKCGMILLIHSQTNTPLKLGIVISPARM